MVIKNAESVLNRHPRQIIGSQDVPFIYEDRISKEYFLNALRTIHNMSKKEREEMGRNGREHAIENYNYENHLKTWVDTVDYVCEKYGSWENRKNYKSWSLTEVL